MTLSPLAYADSLRIENIDFVSPDEIKVLLDIEAPDNVALNTGTPRPFPRINGYVLVPSDEGHLVAQVEWITVERSQYSKRKGPAKNGGLERCMDVRLLQSPHRLPYGSGGKRKRTYSSTVPPRPGVCTDVAVCGAVCSFRSCSYPLREASARASVHRVGTRHRSVDSSMVFLAGSSSLRRCLLDR